MLVQLQHWLGNRPMVVADSSFAALQFLASVSHRPNPVHVVIRRHLDAVLYEPALLRNSHTIGRPRNVGQRLATLDNRLEDSTTHLIETWSIQIRNFLTDLIDVRSQLFRIDDLNISPKAEDPST